MASDVAVKAGKRGAADLTPQIVAADPAAVSQTVSNLETVKAVVASYGSTQVAPTLPAASPGDKYFGTWGGG